MLVSFQSWFHRQHPWFSGLLSRGHFLELQYAAGLFFFEECAAVLYVHMIPRQAIIYLIRPMQ